MLIVYVSIDSIDTESFPVVFPLTIFFFFLTFECKQ